MKNIVRDNEFRTLERMSIIHELMRSVFPGNKEIADSWSECRKEVLNILQKQHDRIKSLDNSDE